MWNGPSPQATQEDLLVGAVDTICSQLENRRYQNGSHSYEEIPDVMKKSHQKQKEAVMIIFPEMQKLEQPKLERLINLLEFPNIGLSDEAYEEIFLRTQEVTILFKAFGQL